MGVWGWLGWLDQVGIRLIQLQTKKMTKIVQLLRIIYHLFIYKKMILRRKPKYNKKIAIKIL